MMGQGSPPPRKAERVDVLLGEWPTTDRAALEWDEAAERVVAAAAAGVSGGGEAGKRAFADVSDEDLLRAPLPESPEEVQISASAIQAGSGKTGMTTASRERDRVALRDLAKLAQMTPSPPSGPASSPPVADDPHVGEAKKEDSGLINLGALAASETTKAAPAAEPLGAVVASAGSTLRSAEQRPAAAPQAPAAPKKSRWLLLGGVASAAAVAAAAFFGMQRAERTPPPATVAVAPLPPAVTAARPPAPVQPMATIPPSDQGVDPSTLPPAATSLARVPGPAVAAKPLVAVAAPTAAPAPDPALVAVVPTTTPPSTGSAENLQALMQQAAGVTSSPTAPTKADAPEAVAPGSVPLKPSQGAIQGALGAALPAARACLGPDDPISHATITFKSDGSVQTVAISGGAAGKPAEACIRSALLRARIPPFAQPTFTAPTTVRPN
jgi:hypothetical protein